MTKNGVEFLIGWRDFPLDKDETWEPITSLPGSEHMIAEFQRHWEEQYKIKNSNTSPHRGNARVTVFLQWNLKAFTSRYRILR